MEHAQRAIFGLVRRVFSASLNPYFNGTCSKRVESGTYDAVIAVLILILMEHAQRVKDGNPLCVVVDVQLLILILMEHAQRVVLKLVFRSALISLNPYFNGTCSKSTVKMTYTEKNVSS